MFHIFLYFFIRRVTWLCVIFWRHYEMRENNHAHSTATSVHSNKLTVSTKHFWEKQHLRGKSQPQNQILAYMKIASAKSLSARGASRSPAGFHSFQKFLPCLRSRWVSLGVLYPIMLMMVVLAFRLTKGEIFMTL